MPADFLISFYRKNRFLFFASIILGSTLVYALPRLIGLKTLPPFIDEFIYVRWAQQGFFNPDLRLISFVDGKQPLFIWLIIFFMKYVSNPLLAGKITSIFVGLGSMFGLGYIGYLLFKRFDIAVLTMVFYALFPFAIIHDRLAIYDSLVTFWFVWAMLCSILFVRKPSLGYALLLANVMAGALLTKSTTALFFLLIPLFFFLQPQKIGKKQFFTTCFYSLIVLIFSYFYLAIIMRLSSSAYFVSTRNSEFVRQFADIISKSGILLSFSNVWTVVGWIFIYTTIPILLVSFVPLFIQKLRTREMYFLYASVFIPFLIFCFVGRNIFPRHVFFFTVPLLILASYASIWIIGMLQRKVLKIIFILFLFSGLFITDWSIVHNLPTALIPQIDRYQLANGWPAGYGVNDIITYLQTASQGKQITIAVEGSYGSLPKTASQLYFSQNPNVHIVDFDTNLTPTIPPQIVEAAQNGDVYLFFNVNQKFPNWPMKKIIEVQKGVGNEYIRLFQYIPPQQK